MIILLAGLPGTGKSTLARALATRLPHATIVSKDELRAALFHPHLTPYSSAQDDFIMELMLLHLRPPPHTLILDGRTFSRDYQRQRVRHFATQRGVATVILECTCAEPIALQRIAADRNHPALNRTIDLYHRAQRHFEPIPQPQLTVDTGRPLEVCLAQILAALPAPAQAPEPSGPSPRTQPA